MKLYIWNGDSKWGIPSIDLKSMQLLAYIKFSGAPVAVHKVANPLKCPGYHLPVFECSEGLLTEFSQVSSFLRKQNYSCDYELSPKQCSEIVAYEQLLREKLYPALVYLWWVEPKSYYDITHKWYFQNIPFPLNLWYPGRLHRQQNEFISRIYDEQDDLQAIETEIHKHAQECLTMLSNRLGDRDFFYGHSPSSMDAIILPYLTLLLKVDLKVSVLQNHLKACPNLSRYVSRSIHRYFTADSPTELSSSRESPSKDDFPYKGRNLFLSTLVAITAMVGYALATGLVQVEVQNSSRCEEEYDYDDYDEYEQQKTED